MQRLNATDIKYVKGVGPKRAALLSSELGIKSVGDLLRHFPTHYIDRTRMYAISSFSGEMPAVQIRGRFVSFAIQGEGAKSRLTGLFSDGTATMEVVWFRQIKKLKELYATMTDYVLFGKPTSFCGRWSMVHPEVEPPSDMHGEGSLRPVYPLTEKLRNQGVNSRVIHTMIRTVVDRIALGGVTDPMPPDILRRLGLPPLSTALRDIHCPSSPSCADMARARMKFDELFYLQLDILQYTRRRKLSVGGMRFPHIGHYFNTFYKECMPFELTGAQKRVIKEIRADMGSGRQMNRLLQGDVGSGKTLVALLCMLIALDNSTQACMMAPTEILAAQHYETISRLVAPIGINVKMLTGSTPASQRAVIHRQLEDGSLHILIGTHAVIEDNVVFRNLGFTVIDEQHRFGVAQRARIWKKNTVTPHILVMTATPIPRTLAMTVYGDLDVSVIDELPPGRKPVTTMLRFDDHRIDVYKGMGRELKAGRQAYIVYPLIKENEKVDMRSLEEGYEFVRDNFPSYRVAFVHGRMKPAEKDHQMELFATHQADILVATTVIEVGVNVPNASVMIIENAERFGLSQLHQLRGRVGRGADQSYCILMTKQNISADTRKRLQVMTSTTDGFLVAEADLKMRGPGDLEGTLQSGLAVNLKIASLASDGRLVELARNAASDILDNDPFLEKPEHMAMRREYDRMYQRASDWSRIS